MLQRLEDLERQRGAIVRSQIITASKSIETLGGGIGELSNRVRDLCQAVDVDEDLRSFVTQAYGDGDGEMMAPVMTLCLSGSRC